MKMRNVWSRLHSSAAMGMIAAAAIVAAHGTAKAESVCEVGSQGTFSCASLSGGEESTAHGAFTQEALLNPLGYAPLDVLSVGDLSVSLEGVMIADNIAVSLNAQGGALSYVSTGTTISTGGWTNTVLRGDSVNAITGTVIVNGTQAGVDSFSLDGDNLTTGGTTTVTGERATAFFSTATNGNNVVNSGTISATGLNSWGLRATTNDGTSCGTNTVNVTGDISAYRVGLIAVACGDSTINVESGNTVSTFGPLSTGATVGNIAVNGHATTIIDGSIRSLAPDWLALVVYAGSSDIVIKDGGELFGSLRTTAPGTLMIESGGTWTTGGINDFSGGMDLLTNAGTIRIGSPVTSFAGLETFTNLGSIDLQNGVAGDILTLSGDYTGSNNAALRVDVNGTDVDKLVINGTASGTTYVFVNGIETVTSLPVGIVEAGSMSADAFVLGNSAATPLLKFSMNVFDGQLFVSAAPNAIAFQPALVSEVTQGMWHQSAESFTSHARLRRLDAGPFRKLKIGLWGQPYGSSSRHGNTDTQTVFGSASELDNRVSTDRRGAQLGIDLIVGSFVLGLTSGYERAQADHRNDDGGVKAKGHNIGVYAQFGGLSGLYAGLLIKKDWTNVRMTNVAFAGADGDPDSRSTGVDGEAGYRSSIGGVGIDVSAGMTHVRSKVDGFNASGITYDFDRAKSSRGRLAVRGEFGSRLGLFVDAKLYREFEGDNEMTLTSGTEVDSVEIDSRSTWGRLEVGISRREKPGAMLSGWVDVGDVKGVGLKAGLRF